MIFLIFKWVVYGCIAVLFFYYCFGIFLWYFEPSKCSEEETKRFLTLVRRNRGEDNGF